MHKNVEITLEDNSTAGSKPKIFSGQTVEIERESPTVVQGVDGHMAIGRHPSKIFWLGGAAKELQNITEVKIVAHNGEVLIKGELNTFYDLPSNISNGVEFAVM